MTATKRRLRIRLSSRPSAVRMVDEPMREFAKTRRTSRENLMREQGRAQGHAEATENAAKALEGAEAALDAMRREAVDQVAETAAQLAVEIVQELLRVELIAENYDIVSIVRDTLAAAADVPGCTTVHVNPADAEQLCGVPFRTGTTLEPDPAVRRGDVRVRTSQGLLVRDIDACACAIRERILEEVS